MAEPRRVEVDQLACEGHARCLETAPEVFRLNDEDVSQAVKEILEAEGIDVRVDSTCMSVEKRGNKIAIKSDCDGTSDDVEGSHLLVAVGRRPNTDDLGLEKAGIETDARGFIVVDDELRTNVPGGWAIGDVNGRGAFTHTS